MSTNVSSTQFPLPATPPPQTFPLFPLLPAELRLKIWFWTLPPARILKISYSANHGTYISNTAPPLALSICHSSRLVAQSHYSYLQLGPTPIPIPISFPNDTLYISNLAPILSSHLADLLYNLAVSPSRHFLQSLSLDLRVWNELCENGLLSTLAKMRELREVNVVVEFGRNFGGELGFLDTPEWRRDLMWLAARAGRRLVEETGRLRLLRKADGRGNSNEKEDAEKGVKVRCVILTRGGEQA
jgi:hypothetical protein